MSGPPISQLEPFSGTSAGQTLDTGLGYVTIMPTGSGLTAGAELALVGTNQPNATFQVFYRLDGGAPVTTGIEFTTDSFGNGTCTFNIGGLTVGSHTLIVEINNTPAPGNTYYLTTAPGGMPFTVGPAWQLGPFSGTQAGQTLNIAGSYVVVMPFGSTAVVEIVLAQTNQPSTTFQVYYRLDSGAPVATGVQFTTDANGTGTGKITIVGLAAGSHTLVIEINSTPGPGNTYYLTTASGGIPVTIGPYWQLTPCPGSLQTLNTAASYVTASGAPVCAVEVVIAQSNLANCDLQIGYQIDSQAPIYTDVIMTTDAHGNGAVIVFLDFTGTPIGNHNVMFTAAIPYSNVDNTPAKPVYTIAAPGVPITIPAPAAQQIVPFSGTQAGQSINSALSYVSVNVASTSSGLEAGVQVVINQTAPNFGCHLFYRLDGSPPVDTNIEFAADIYGNAQAAFIIPGLVHGPHNVIVEINNLPAPGNTYYVTAASNGVPFTA